MPSVFGHFLSNIEMYLCEWERENINTIDFVYYSYIPNQQIKKMWDRVFQKYPHIVVLPSPLFRVAHATLRWNQILPKGNPHIVKTSNVDIHGFFSKTQPHLYFTSKEEQQGKEALKKMGIPENIPFVCFFSRDSKYKESIDSGNRKYHCYRNANIKNYLLAAEKLSQRNYFAVRMGFIVEETINTSNPKIIDYSCNGQRTPFLDIYLGARCDFFICTPSGICSIPESFKRPIVYTNVVPMELMPSWFDKSLVIVKKLWLKREKRFMKFKEILESKVGLYYRAELYEKAGIEVIDNTPEEIAEVSIEMDERLRGTRETTKEDEELQQRFWTLFKNSDHNGIILARMGTEFLRDNRDLLD